ncbi:hypothetical protein ACQP1W_32475 [Spirillospora sp. CA-255316]
MTGIIARTEPPGIMTGAVGLSVSGSGKHQRFGFSWGILPPSADLPRCYGIAPFTTVTSGHFTVRHGPTARHSTMAARRPNRYEQ